MRGADMVDPAVADADYTSAQQLWLASRTDTIYSR